MNEHLGANLAWWNERVSFHAASDFYDLESFKRCLFTLMPLERR